MSKYYKEHKSNKSKTGGRIILALMIIVLVGVAALSVAFVIVPKILDIKGGNTTVPPDNNGEQPTIPTLDALSAPYELSLDNTQTRLSWKCRDSNNSIGYRLKINAAEYNVYTNPVDINLIEGQESQISIKALGDGVHYKDSDWSAPLIVFKQEAQYIAYQMAVSSMTNFLETNVKVLYGGANRNIAVQEVYTIDYGSSSAKVWYSYKVQSAYGLACTTVAMPSVSGVIDYKNKLSQITAIINNNNFDTVAMTFANDDYTTALLARADLTGNLANYKHQNSILTPVCSYTSTVTISGGLAKINFVGIIRRERTGGTINYYTYNYTASTNTIAGYTAADYFAALADNSLTFVYSEQPSLELSGLGKEMLIIAHQHKEG